VNYNNHALLQESAAAMSSGSKVTESDVQPALGRRRSVVQTLIDVSETPNGAASVLRITTADRPGLLVDIVRVLKDINLNVVSAEVDTVGSQAQDEFFLTYHGEPLTTPMVTLVTNALQYYLSLNEMAKEESY
jgi:UTP:GlnB (protein PII) uridylyltransferase